MNPVAYHFTIHGRVQGVGYRDYAYHSAIKNKIKGFVRNLSTGSVEIWAEGIKELIEKFKQDLEVGPTFADVQKIDEKQGNPTFKYLDFQVSK